MKLATRLALTLLVTAVPLTVGLVFLREHAERRADTEALAEYALGRMQAGLREACEEAPEFFQDPPFRPRGDRRLGGDRGPGGDRRPGLPGSRDPLGLGPNPPGQRGPLGRPDRADRPEGPPPGLGALRFELWAYNPDYRSDNPAAPDLAPTLRAELERGAERVAHEFRDPERALDREFAREFARDPDRPALPARTGLEVAVRMPWSTGPCAIVLARRVEIAGDGPTPFGRFGVPALLAAALVLTTLFAFLPFVRRVRALTVGVERSASSGYADPVGARGSDELSDLGRAFDAAAAQVREQIERLERRERSLRDFVENTTHDVMLPLTVLQGHLVALEKLASASDPTEVARIREAQEEAHYLGALLENLGAAARLEANELPLTRHRVSLNRLIERAVSRQLRIARGKGIELDHALPGEEVLAEADVTLFERAVSNLVHNAVAHGREGGHVAVALEIDGERFRVRVLDDGPGVSDEELVRLAERSYRTEAARRRHPTGTGLGLSIAKEVCERHGFDFELRRSEAGGLEAILSGPRALGAA